MIALSVYGVLTVLLAVWLGVCMRRLDRFDWYYGDVWLSFWLYLALWPLLLLKPGCIIRPQFLVTVGSVDIAARERELDGLRTSPPPCSERIYYLAAKQGRGVFVFSAASVERALLDVDRLRAGVMYDVLRWVANRRVNAMGGEAVTVPPAWWMFCEVAARLIRSGDGNVVCSSCGWSGPVAQLTEKSVVVINHSFSQWSCDCGELLLQIDGLHIHRAAHL